MGKRKLGRLGLRNAKKASKLSLYTKTVLDIFTRGRHLVKKDVSASGLIPQYSCYMTKDYIKKIWVVTGVPYNFDGNITHNIRTEMHKTNPECKTIIQMHAVPADISLNSPKFKAKGKEVENAYAKYREIFESTESDIERSMGRKLYVNGKSFHVSKDRLKKLEIDKISYQYMLDSKEQGETFAHVYTFIEVLAPNLDALERYTINLKNAMYKYQIFMKDIEGFTNNYLEDFGILGCFRKTQSFFTKLLMTNKNMAYNSPFQRGGITTEKGIYMGHNCESETPLFLNFFETSLGRVVLVLGKAGSGKTFGCYQIAGSLLQSGVHCSISDIKGNEWVQFANQGIPYQRISIDGNSGVYVNTLRLDDLDTDRENAKTHWHNAVSGTTQLLAIMVGKEDISELEAENVIHDAVVAYYTLRGVDPKRPQTFINSKDMNYKGVMDLISERNLQVKGQGSNSQKKTARQVLERLARYINTKTGTLFECDTEITLKQVLETPLIIYEFNKNNASTSFSIDDTIRVFMAQFLDVKKQSYRKSKGLHTAIFYEELARCDQFGKMLTFIQSTVTGGRSNNVMVFLLCNAITSFENNSEMRKILSNITTKIVGKLSGEDAELLINKYDMQHVSHYLRQLSDPEYKGQNHFVVSFDSGATQDYALFKVVMPRDMAEGLRTSAIK